MQPEQTPTPNQLEPPVPPAEPVPTVGPVVPPAAPTSGPPPLQPTPAKSGMSRLLMIIIGILVLVIIGGAIAFVMTRGNKKQNNSTTASTGTPAGSAQQEAAAKQQETAAKQPAAAPKTADTVDTLCYSFTMPTPHDDIPADNTCMSSLYYGSDKVASVAVDASISEAANLDGMVSDWKKSNTDTLVSETKGKLGSYDMDKIITKTKGVAPATRITVLTYTGDKYKVSGYTVPGFEIRGRYDDQYGSKAGMDSILASWQWK